MKKTLLLALITLYGLTLSAQNTIYVSPRGSDTGLGNVSSPLKSLPKALEKARLINTKDTVYVNIDKGEYIMDAPLVITSIDTKPIVFRGAGAGKSVFYGGIRIGGWEKVSDKLWKAKVPETALYGYNFEQLWVNGKHATRARTPNMDWFEVQGSKEIKNTTDTYANGISKYASQKIEVPKNVSDLLVNLSPSEQEDVVVTFYHKWDVTRKLVEYVSSGESPAIYILGKGAKPWNSIAKGSRFVLENYKGALDEAGEWFLDKTGELFYVPFDGQKIEEMECYAPRLKEFISVKGTSEIPVTNKIFKGISFRVSKYEIPRHGDEPQQVAADVPSAVTIDFAKNISFFDCEIGDTGAYALWFRQECVNSVVERTRFYDLGAGGIKIGRTIYEGENLEKVTNNIIIRNNIIQHAGFVFPCGSGVIVFNAHDCTITHNEISDLRYTGISVGWKWGYNSDKTKSYSNTNNPEIRITYKDKLSNPELIDLSPSYNNTVSFNNVHHIGWCELSDMGGIYTLGESPGTKVYNNIVSNIYSYDYGGWGIYTDEGSSDIVIENNLTFGCKSGGFHQHYGRDNIVRNNIFAFGYFYQMQYTKAEKHKSFSFTNNIVIFDDKVLISDGAWKSGKIDMHDNLYWNMGKKQLKFANLDFKEWQKTHDKGSIIADPMFVNPKEMNFEFRNMKNAKKIGFKPFDLSKVGVYGTPEWIEKAKLKKEIIDEFETRKVKNLSKGSDRTEK